MPKTAPVDADAQAFLTAAGITDPTISGAINTLVVQMKADNIWTKMKAIYPMVGGTASTHKFNLKDPRDLDAAFRLSFAGGWTHSANGALPNGTNAYANTFLIAPNNGIFTRTSHLSYYSRTEAAGSVSQFYEIGSGNFTGSELYALFIRRAAGNGAYDSGSSVNNRNSFTNTDGRGFYLGKVNNDITSKVFKNGALIATKTIIDDIYISPYNIYLGGFNEQNSALYYSNRECAFASIGTGLSDTESANFYTAVQAFQTTLNRQV